MEPWCLSQTGESLSACDNNRVFTELLRRAKTYLEPGLFPFTLVIILVMARFIWAPLGLPDTETLIIVSRGFFEQYGYAALFVSAFLESLFMISFYFPGSFMVVLAIIVSDRSLYSLSIIACVGIASVLAATAVNYWLGREGFYRLLLRLGSRGIVERMQAWLDRYGLFTLFVSGMHPNFLAVANICMGIAREGLLKSLTYSFGTLLFWIPAQIIILGFILPDPLHNAPHYYTLAIVVFFVWGVFLVVKESLYPKES